MGRSKATQRRRKLEKTDQEIPFSAAAEEREASTETLFRVGELLSREDIEERISQSKLVRRADDEYFRLMKARFFKRVDGKLLVRGEEG
jgi:hypothetical protein